MKSKEKHRKLCQTPRTALSLKNNPGYVRLAKHTHYNTSPLITRSVKERVKVEVWNTRPSSSLCLRGLVFCVCLFCYSSYFPSLVLLICPVCLYFYYYDSSVTIFCVWGSLRSTEDFFFIVFHCAAVDPWGAPAGVRVRMYVYMCVISSIRSQESTLASALPPPAGRAAVQRWSSRGAVLNEGLKLKAVHWDACDYAGTSPWGVPDNGTQHLFAPKPTAWLRGFCYINMNINSLSWIELPFSFLSAPLSLQVQIRMASFMCLYCQV